MDGVSEVKDDWEESKTKRQRFSPSAALRMMVGIGITAFLVWNADISQIAAAISRLDPLWLAVAFGIQLTAKAVWTLRWSALLHIFEMPTSFWRLMKAIYVGLFFSNFLPTNIGGDLVRAHWILNEKELYRKSLFVVFIERFVGLVSLGYVALVPFFALLILGLRLWENTSLILLLLIGLCAGILVLHPAVYDLVNDRLLGGVAALTGVRRKISEALHAWHAAGKRKWHIFLLSVMVHVAGILFFYSLGRGLRLGMSAWHYFVIVPITVVVSLLPVSINGLGIREGALVILTGALGTGVLPAEAVVLGLLSSAISLVVSLPGAFFYIAGQGSNAEVIEALRAE
jgi:uncharacterized protein (TIRG00374 family)